MMTHELKTTEEFFLRLRTGEKNFEIRRNDRCFKVGDILILREWTGANYTGEVEVRTVTYLTDFEQKPGFVVMATSRAVRGPRHDLTGPAFISRTEGWSYDKGLAPNS